MIVPLGVGGGFTKRYYHSNFYIKIGDEGILIDAGTTLRDSLSDAQIELESINYIYITHFHHDHVGGLSELLTKAYWRYKEGHHQPHRPLLFMRPCQVKLFDNLLSPALNNQGITWREYCTVHVIEDNSYENGNFKITVIPTDNLHCEGMQSSGLKIHEDVTNNEIIISGDIKALNSSNLKKEISPLTKAVFQDIRFTNNSVHSSIKEVLEYYPEDIHSLIYGIHYEDFFNPSQNKTHPIFWAEQGIPIYL